MSVASIVQEVEQACIERELRLTPTRRRVLELIISAEGPVKAYDLLESLSREDQNNQRRAAPPTIYRALDFLLDNHFIHRLERLNAFVCCVHPEEAHNGQFLICQGCDTVVEVPGINLSKEVLAAADAQGFAADKHVVEVYGKCHNCQ